MNQKEPLDKTDYPIVFGLLFGLNLVTGCRDLSRSVYHVQGINIPCFDSIGFPSFIRLNWIESYDSTKLVLFGDLNKLSLITYSLFLLKIYTLTFFSSYLLGRW